MDSKTFQVHNPYGKDFRIQGASLEEAIRGSLPRLRAAANVIDKLQVLLIARYSPAIRRGRGGVELCFFDRNQRPSSNLDLAIVKLGVVWLDAAPEDLATTRAYIDSAISEPLTEMG